MPEDSPRQAPVPEAEPQGRLTDPAARRAKMTKNIEYGIIGVLCLMIIGFLAFSRTSSGKAPDAAAPSPGVHSRAIVARDDGKSEETGPVPSLVAGTVKPRDPFEPMMVAEVSKPARTPTRMSSMKLPKGFSPLMPIVFGGKGLPSLPGNISTSAVNPASSLTVTGILVGEPSVAIIRDGNAGRFYVRVGDKIGGNMTVLSIKSGRVLLQAGGTNVVLTLGGKKDAS